MGEAMKELPPGWTVSSKKEEPEQELGKQLPAGWKKTTPEDRDITKLKKAAGPFIAEEKTAEDLKKMSVAEKLQYIEDLNREREAIAGPEFGKGAVSGLTLGVSENIPGFKPLQLEGSNPFQNVSSAGELYGSLVPLSLLTKVVSFPVNKLVSKSPILQRQLSSLLTMFGVGASEQALRTIGQGEMPTVEDVLNHGTSWAALDAGIQALGLGGRFAKALLGFSNKSGLSRKDIVNRVAQVFENTPKGYTQEELADAMTRYLETGKADEKLLQSGALDSFTEEMTQKGITEAEAGLEETVGKVAEEEAITSKDLKSRKIEPMRTEKLNEEIPHIAEPVLQEGVSLRSEAESLERDTINELIESVGERAATEEELGTAIREDVESRLMEAKKAYVPLYVTAEKAAGDLVASTKRTGEVAGNSLKAIEREGMRTKPEGYKSTLKHIKDVLTDSGYVVQRDDKGLIEFILKDKKVAADDLIELGRRLNDIINFERLEPSVENALKKVVKAVKEDIRVSLKPNAEALAAFEMAEAEHAQVAEKFGRKSVKGMRYQESGEKIAKASESPTALKDLREVLSPEQMLQVEREILEKMNSKSYGESKKMFDKLRNSLSEDSRFLAREIVESKNPNNPKVRERLLKQGIVEDMSNAYSTGERPNRTLNLWKTTKGQRLVKDAFHNSPNWPEVKSYLEKQSFADMVKSVSKDGRINSSKFKELMKDPAFVNNIRSQGGEEAVQFFRQYDSMIKQMENNAKLLEKLPSQADITRVKKMVKETQGHRLLDRMVAADFPTQAKIKSLGTWMKESLGWNEKAVLSAIGLMKLGIKGAVPAMIGYRLMQNLMTKASLRGVFRQAGTSMKDPLMFMLTLEDFAEMVEGMRVEQRLSKTRKAAQKAPNP